ncbi:MAG: tRNA 2-selenouridine(34) synthase MnmH [Bacteroidales bacterium]|nr:tRNA 2-selenouridine(34) synthase MnmH [Bacteroidales bacterium]
MTGKANTRTDIVTFLKLAETLPVADVRSPSEYSYGHIPGAFNIPLFDDSEREEVGTRYKRKGRVDAILKGLELTGPSMYRKLEQALHIAAGGKLLVHCWRGGMRSEAMAWLFSLGGIETVLLEGGYKSYRHLVLESLARNRKMFVLGGLTGSGKTHILKYLREQGKQVIDLEGLANHKGSAFGSLGQEPQPSSEHFANILYSRWKDLDTDKPVWIEDESRNIGTVFMPDDFYNNMQINPTIVLLMDIKTRLPRLIEEYSFYGRDELEASVMRISKRLGGDRAQEAIEAIRRHDFARAIEITLQYYDKAYLYGLKRKETKEMVFVETDTDDIETNARKIVEAAEKFKE